MWGDRVPLRGTGRSPRRVYSILSPPVDSIQSAICSTARGISLSEISNSSLGRLAGNYGEAGAINVYGPAYNLPHAISGIDSFWLWGYGNPPPETVIVLGLTPYYASSLFETCSIAGTTANPYGIQNEESQDHPEILLCRHLRQPWEQFWKNFHYFG